MADYANFVQLFSFVATPGGVKAIGIVQFATFATFRTLSLV